MSLVRLLRASALLLLLLPRVATAAPLRWASDAQSGAPFVFHDPADQSRLTGFEFDLIQVLARRIGSDPVFVQNDWDGLIPGLQRDLYDVVIDGIEITPEHQAAVDFSTPYYRTAERIAVRRDATGLDSVPALRGHVVGTLKDTLSQRLLEQAGGITLRSYDDETNAYSDLANGRLDAVMLDEPIALYYAVPDPRLKLVGGPIGALSYGIAIAKGHDALRARIDDGLDALRRDGTLRRILQRWAMWTPEMASFTGDHSTEIVPPTAWRHWLQATRPVPGWRDRLLRYAGFLPLVGRAALMTLAVSACAMVLAVAWGLLLALGAPVRDLAAAHGRHPVHRGGARHPAADPDPVHLLRAAVAGHQARPVPGRGGGAGAELRRVRGRELPRRAAIGAARADGSGAGAEHDASAGGAPRGGAAGVPLRGAGDDQRFHLAAQGLAPWSA